MMQIVARILVLLAVGGVCCGKSTVSTECTSSQDCGNNGCCVIGASRYSIATCQPLLAEAETCHPLRKAFHASLRYPGSVVDVARVYHEMCPCQPGLSCIVAGDTPRCTKYI